MFFLPFVVSIFVCVFPDLFGLSLSLTRLLLCVHGRASMLPLPLPWPGVL